MGLLKKKIWMVDAYGEKIKVEQTKRTTTTLGGKHTVLAFAPPDGYLRPKTIIHLDGIEPCYTDSFVMMNPWSAEAPGIEGVEEACRMNLKAATRAVLLSGIKLSRWIEWEDPLKMKQDRGWFKVLKRPSTLVSALKETGAMIQVPGTLHHPHKPNFELVASFKTRHRIPVLQITLWHDIGEWVAEVDIDLKQGPGHWGEVIKNHLTNGKTHPYVVNQLLAWYWGVISFKLCPTGIAGNGVTASG